MGLYTFGNPRTEYPGTGLGWYQRPIGPLIVSKLFRINNLNIDYLYVSIRTAPTLLTFDSLLMQPIFGIVPGLLTA